jgi:hypothetical protein
MYEFADDENYEKHEEGSNHYSRWPQTNANTALHQPWISDV